MTGITARPEVGLSIQHDPMLATVPPELLPPLLIYPSNQRRQILSGTCSEVTNCHRPCYHRITHQREQLVTYCISSNLLSHILSKAFVLFFSLLHPFVLFLLLKNLLLSYNIWGCPINYRKYITIPYIL